MNKFVLFLLRFFHGENFVSTKYKDYNSTCNFSEKFVGSRVRIVSLTFCELDSFLGRIFLAAERKRNMVGLGHILYLR